MSKTWAGMRAVRAVLTRYQITPPSAEHEMLCYNMATEIRAEINSLWAAKNGAVINRPGKNETARRQAHIDGMKWILGLVMGVPLGDRWEVVDGFLEAFRDERLKAKEKVG